MIVLDTNVISEAMRDVPDRSVAEWLAEQTVSDLATTTLNIAEIKFGFALLGRTRRRGELEARFQRLAAQGFESRILGLDALAADAYGDLAAARQRSGRRIGSFDGLIAAIALSRGASIATRDVRDFSDCGVPLINPWDARSA